MTTLLDDRFLVSIICRSLRTWETA